MNIIILGIFIILADSLLTSTQISLSPQQLHLPLTLQSLLTSSSVSKVELTMNHLTRNTNTSHEGILMHIHSEIQLPTKTASQIISAFGVSEKIQFRLWDPLVKITTIADPNDRLCNEIIESLFRIFIPCRNWGQSGLKHLVFLDQITQNYLSFNLVWTLNHSQLFLVHDTDSKMVRQFQGQTSCGIVKVTPSFVTSFQKIQVRRVSLSKWYNPSKTIAYIIKPTTIDYQYVKILIRMLAGFKLTGVQVVKGNVSISHVIDIMSDLAQLITITIDLPIREELIIHLSVDTHMPLFEMFQTIGGGGQQFMGLTRIYNRTDRIQIGANSLVQYQMMPDFSINFHTITAYVAIILIIWLSLWRNHSTFAEQSALQDNQ